MWETDWGKERILGQLVEDFYHIIQICETGLLKDESFNI